MCFMVFTSLSFFLFVSRRFGLFGTFLKYLISFIVGFVKKKSMNLVNYAYNDSNICKKIVVY